MKKQKAKRNKSHVLNNSQFCKELGKLCPSMRTKYRTIVDDNGIKKQVCFLEFPLLAVCRKAFEQAMGCKIDWPKV
jgi:hypothetical protein